MAQKKLVQYGAGNIGRGFIGELFARSGYEVVYIDVQEQVVDKLNKDRAYPVRYVSDEGYNEIVISGVRAINGMDAGAVAEEIATADVVATAVGVNVLPRIIDPIVAGLKQRLASGNHNPLNIIICENLLDADVFMRNLVAERLSNSETAILENTGFVEASIGRMVPVMTEEMQEGNILRVCVEKYAELPVDGDAIKGEIPHVHGLIPASPFSYYIRRKLFIHNMGHALCAYLGSLYGHEFIAEAIRDPHIRIITKSAMSQAARALAKEYGIDYSLLQDHIKDLIFRFHNRALADTTERVGRDPLRKLAMTDRLAGAALYCMSHGLPMGYISVGIAAGLAYYNATDEASVKIRGMIDSSGLPAVLKSICGIEPASDISMQVAGFYSMLKAGASLEKILNNVVLREKVSP